MQLQHLCGKSLRRPESRCSWGRSRAWELQDGVLTLDWSDSFRFSRSPATSRLTAIDWRLSSTPPKPKPFFGQEHRLSIVPIRSIAGSFDVHDRGVLRGDLNAPHSGSKSQPEASGGSISDWILRIALLARTSVRGLRRHLCDGAYRASSWTRPLNRVGSPAKWPGLFGRTMQRN